ncbi:MAG: CapA family protein [Clostridia bacterium]|nr:CapA family protein [Clostridia bacterium]
MKSVFCAKPRLCGLLLRSLAMILSVMMLFSGCISFRPNDGVGRETTTPNVTEPSVTNPPVTDPPVESNQSDTTEPPVTNPPETEPPAPPPEQRVSILAVGDNIIHEAVFTDAKNRAADGAEYDFVPMYTGVAERISAADIAFINHESPAAGKEYGISGYPTFNSPRESVDALVEVGFDVINLANNHILDKRVAGARATVEYVQSLPVTELGVYLDEEDHGNLRITEVNGVRIAWLSFFDLTILQYNPNMNNIIIPLMDDDAKITSAIADAKTKADFVIVSAHWGREQPQVTKEQKRVAALMSEAGADVILGHHSHILQPVEWHDNADGSRTLVAYSLGNFISTQYYANNMIGGMLTFDVVKDNGGECTLENIVFRPTVTHYSFNRDGLQLYMLEDYTEDMAKTHGTTLKSNPAPFTLQWIYSHVRSVIDETFLPEYFE